METIKQTDLSPKTPVPPVRTASILMPKLIYVILAAVGGLVLLLLVLMVIFRQPTQQTPAVPASLAPFQSTAASFAPRQISEFGRSAQFTQFEDKLNQLKKDNLAVDLNESQLSYPYLDMQVSFSK